MEAFVLHAQYEQDREQFAEALHSVLFSIAANTDRSDISLTLYMIFPRLTLSGTKKEHGRRIEQ